VKKLLSLLLCLALLLSLTPAVYADDEMPEEPAPEEEVFEEAPAEEAEEPPAEEPDEPAEEPPAEAASDETDGEEQTDSGEDDTDGGPEYGVQPEEERTESEELPEEEEPSVEETPAEEQPGVLVRFSCDPGDTVVTVYEGTQRADGSWVKIGAATEGKCLLLPGSYVYDAVCDGYNSDYKVPFTVETPDNPEVGIQPEQIVNVTLFPLDEGALFDEDEEPLPLRTTPPEPLIVLPVEPDPGRGTPTVFLQSDVRWAAKPYNYSDSNDIATIASAGCDPGAHERGLLSQRNLC
jgi:hypothetical protein